MLAGEAQEALFAGAFPVGEVGAITLFKDDHWLLGAATLSLTDGVEVASRQLYRDIFRATRGQQLARIWNYVPAINGLGADGMENYRLFCRGRSVAFEEHYGTSFKVLLPSASAVGCVREALTVVFAASPAVPRHIENPLQIPAYEYPVEYGPRPPSFARATVVPGSGVSTVFISGTAAIRGHATVSPQDLPGQLTCAIENLREISSACGLGPDLDRRGASIRHFKIYLRRAADLPLVSAALETSFLNRADPVSYVQADICREALLVEIEATLFGVKSIPDCV